MISADTARALTPVEDKLQEYERKIDEAIMNACKRGIRTATVSVGSGYDYELAKKYRECGYTVEHYISPRTELTFIW